MNAAEARILVSGWKGNQLWLRLPVVKEVEANLQAWPGVTQAVDKCWRILECDADLRYEMLHREIGICDCCEHVVCATIDVKKWEQSGLNLLNISPLLRRCTFHVPSTLESELLDEPIIEGIPVTFKLIHYLEQNPGTLIKIQLISVQEWREKMVYQQVPYIHGIPLNTYEHKVDLVSRLGSTLASLPQAQQSKRKKPEIPVIPASSSIGSVTVNPVLNPMLLSDAEQAILAYLKEGKPLDACFYPQAEQWRQKLELLTARTWMDLPYD